MAKEKSWLLCRKCKPLKNELIYSASHQSKENLWHRRFGHFGKRSLCILKKDELVNGLDYDVSKEIDFCESCVTVKIHRS
jgi:hypothetical protein